jgi:hypothetical protein
MQSILADIALTTSPTAWALTPFRMLSPKLKKLGTPAFQRWLAERWPNPHVKKAIHVIDTLEKTSRQIFQQKKIALEDGDEAVMHQIGEGKDIMSRLCKFCLHHGDDADSSQLSMLSESES